ncbi:MAG: hypothetical protein RQ729_12915, partial [Wenzhouxiangellaceae bacterium]|nr:hypothetical protein [Wenzhouxiangellaceae bacterium]
LQELMSFFKIVQQGKQSGEAVRKLIEKSSQAPSKGGKPKALPAAKSSTKGEAEEDFEWY